MSPGAGDAVSAAAGSRRVKECGGVERAPTSHQQPAYFPSHQPPDTGPRTPDTLTEAPRWRAAPRRPAQPRTEQ